MIGKSTVRRNYLLLMEYKKLTAHGTDCCQFQKKLGQNEKNEKISITFTAAAEGEQNQ